MTDGDLAAQMRDAVAALPPARLAYHIRPAAVQGPLPWAEGVDAALRRPIGAPALAELAAGARNAVVLVDDITRPTPQSEILPPLLDHLNAAGIGDPDVTAIVALGTHRYMTEAEIRQRLGDEVCDRVRAINHEWRDPDALVDLGMTEGGTPIIVNRLAREADLLIGTGSIVPHVYAGWSAGAKIVQPGICGAATTARTHCMAADGPDLLGMAGAEDNPVRREMEQVAALVGLDFVLNVVSDAAGAPAWVGAGHFVQAHRAGVRVSREVYVRPVPAPADVVVVDATPATIDYWQGAKALAHAQRGVRPGGTVVLVAEFPEGIAQTHPQLAEHAREPYAAIVRACREGRIEDAIASATLRLHALIRERCDVICVSPGLGRDGAGLLGFAYAESVAEGLSLALEGHPAGARVGVIEHGGDLLPEVRRHATEAPHGG